MNVAPSLPITLLLEQLSFMYPFHSCLFLFFSLIFHSLWLTWLRQTRNQSLCQQRFRVCDQGYFAILILADGSSSSLACFLSSSLQLPSPVVCGCLVVFLTALGISNSLVLLSFASPFPQLHLPSLHVCCCVPVLLQVSGVSCSLACFLSSIAQLPNLVACCCCVASVIVLVRYSFVDVFWVLRLLPFFFFVFRFFFRLFSLFRQDP